MFGWISKLLPSAIPLQLAAASSTGEKVARRQRLLRHLRIRAFQQEFAYSCVAAIVQTVFHYHTGRTLSHEEAVKLTGCDPDGTQLRTAGVVLKRLCGTPHRDVRTLAAAKNALRSGMLVVSNDDVSWADPHAVLYCGATKTGVYVYDPNTAQIKWRKDSFVRVSGANEFIAIFPPADISTRCKPAGKRRKATRIGK